MKCIVVAHLAAVAADAAVVVDNFPHIWIIARAGSFFFFRRFIHSFVIFPLFCFWKGINIRSMLKWCCEQNEVEMIKDLLWDNIIFITNTSYYMHCVLVLKERKKHCSRVAHYRENTEKFHGCIHFILDVNRSAKNKQKRNL